MGKKQRRLVSQPAAVFDLQADMVRAVLQLAPGNQALADAIATDYLESFPGALAETTPSAAALGPLVYTVLEVAKELKISRSKVYEEIKSGNLKRLKIGDRTLVRPAAILKYLADREREARAEEGWRD